MGGGESLELEAPERRLYVHLRYLLVPLEGPLPYASLHAVREPTIHVLPDSDRPCVEDEANGPVGKSLIELLRDLPTCRPVESLALRATYSLNGVAGAPAPVCVA